MSLLKKICLGIAGLSLAGAMTYGGMKLWKNRDVEPEIERYVEFNVDGRKIEVPDYFYGNDENGKQKLHCSKNARWTSKRLGVEGFARCDAWDRPLYDNVVAKENYIAEQIRDAKKVPLGSIVGIRLNDRDHEDFNKFHEYSHNGTVIQGREIVVNGKTYDGPVVVHTVGNEFSIDNLESLKHRGWDLVYIFLPKKD